MIIFCELTTSIFPDHIFILYLCFAFHWNFRGLLNKERIAKMKKGVLIVNNARGALVDTQAMVDACNSGHVAGTYIYV